MSRGCSGISEEDNTGGAEPERRPMVLKAEAEDAAGERWWWMTERDGDRWRREVAAERAALASVRAHGAVHGELKSFGRKKINTSMLVLILLKLSTTVLDENRYCW
jgi:hypothetical protein